jgi:hypothetical protein
VADLPFLGDERGMNALLSPVTGNWADTFDAYVAQLPSVNLS